MDISAHLLSTKTEKLVETASIFICFYCYVLIIFVEIIKTFKIKYNSDKNI